MLLWGVHAQWANPPKYPVRTHGRYRRTPKKLCYFCYACATVRITCYASTTTLLIVSSFVRDRQYVHDIAYAMQCVLCYCCVCQPSPSNDRTWQPSPSNGCAQQHMFCFDMPLVLLALQSLALHTTCAVTTARANTCFALTCAPHHVRMHS